MKFSSGPSKPVYIWIPDVYDDLSGKNRNIEIESHIHHYVEDYRWSEHYRGVEFEIVDVLPEEEINRQIRIYNNKIQEAQLILDTLNRMEVQ